MSSPAAPSAITICNSRRSPACYGILLAALTIAAVAAYIWWAGWPYFPPDSEEYRAYALAGLPINVHRAFAGRVLHPLIVHLLARTIHVNLDATFVIVAVIALVAFCVLLARTFEAVGVPAVVILPMAFTPLLFWMTWAIYSQELMQWALIAGVFLALIRNRVAVAALLLFLAILTRESALLLVLALIFVGWRQSNRGLVAGALVAAVAAMAISTRVAAYSLPNIHHVSQFAFLIFKLPFEFARNVLGLFVVPNTLQNTAGNVCTAVASVALPAFLRFGRLSAVSYCGFNPAWPLNTLLQLTTLFGVLPTLLLHLLLRHRKTNSIANRQWLAIALVFGIVAYLLGTSEGTSLTGEIGAGWPAFWIAVPELFVHHSAVSRKSAARLLLLNFVTCWFAFFIHQRTNLDAAAALVVALSLNCVAWRYIREADPVSLAATMP